MSSKKPAVNPLPRKPRNRRGEKRSFKEKHPDQSPQSAPAARDCQRLIDEFVLKQSVRFEEFVNLWKTKGYSLLQCAVEQRFRREHVELIISQFTLQLRSENLLNCVASIYALYCAYTTQTAVPTVRIRLTAQLYQRVKQVQEWAKSEEHSDLDFVIRQLEWKHAFDLTLFGSELVLGTGKLCLEGGDPLDEFLHVQPPTHMMGVLPDGAAESLQDMLKKYQDTKFELSGGTAILDPLNYLQNSVVDDLKKLVGRPVSVRDGTGKDIGVGTTGGADAGAAGAGAGTAGDDGDDDFDDDGDAARGDDDGDLSHSEAASDGLMTSDSDG